MPRLALEIFERPAITRPEAQPQLHPALLRLSAMISQYFIRGPKSSRSRLWPIGLWEPVVFGVLFAAALSDQSNFVSAFREAMSSFTGGKARIVEALSHSSAAKLIDRLERGGEDWQNILIWGSPVFLQ